MRTRNLLRQTGSFVRRREEVTNPSPAPPGRTPFQLLSQDGCKRATSARPSEAMKATSSLAASAPTCSRRRCAQTTSARHFDARRAVAAQVRRTGREQRHQRPRYGAEVLVPRKHVHLNTSRSVSPGERHCRLVPQQAACRAVPAVECDRPLPYWSGRNGGIALHEAAWFEGGLDGAPVGVGGLQCTNLDLAVHGGGCSHAAGPFSERCGAMPRSSQGNDRCELVRYHPGNEKTLTSNSFGSATMKRLMPKLSSRSACTIRNPPFSTAA